MIGKLKTLVLGKTPHHSALARQRSSLSNTSLEENRLLVQVYAGPLKPNQKDHIV
jgi:hypothetical protein